MPIINSYMSLIIITMQMKLLVFNISNYLPVQNATEVMLHSWCWWLWSLVTKVRVIRLENSLMKGARTESGLVSFFSAFPSLCLLFLCYSLPRPCQKYKGRVHLLPMLLPLFVVLSVNILMYLEGCFAHSHSLVLILSFVWQCLNTWEGTF